MIVLDTSVFVDAIIPFRKDRHELASGVIDLISEKGLELYEPKLLIVELSGILIRFKTIDTVKEHIESILTFINILNYHELHEISLEVALSTGCRAIDAFFIACAKRTDSILISNDELQVLNARRAGVKSFYLLKEFETIRQELGIS
ncbi:MAG: PIN domain-containing protein [Thermoprotei archaeon]|nr:MAG: PIN domain-containing protein [Thermoprotei archaeon]